MKTSARSVRTDLCFLWLLLLLFGGLIFLSYDAANAVYNGVVLFVACMLALVAYFTNLTLGMALNAAFVLALCAHTLATNAAEGIVIPANVYFWVVWSPCLTAAVSFYTMGTRELQSDNRRLRAQIEHFSTIDELTELKNISAFELDANVYMKIARRYDMQLALVVWQFTFPDELDTLLGEGLTREAVMRVSDAIRLSLRTEDAVYLLDDDPFLWGTLLFTRPDAVRLVIERVRERVHAVDTYEFASHKAVPLDLSVGVQLFNTDIIAPLAFLDAAKKNIGKEDVSDEADPNAFVDRLDD